MAAAGWCSSGIGNIGWSRRISENGYDRSVSFNISMRGSKAPIWRVLWRKIRRERQRIFDNSATLRFAYDPYSYSQNFDQGSMLADLDDLSRSFSARFAVPSRVFDQQSELKG
ncbi:uncharacterized protein LOC132280900 [Cornus florida]|uniref:uncharacterized protein LOC132280900 n=1 Tax=Cornus florida TaxID=4283 RepID=UPI0028A02FB0|nr:uncharacterized protein LOC132280900 [Cornus florida]